MPNLTLSFLFYFFFLCNENKTFDFANQNQFNNAAFIFLKISIKLSKDSFEEEDELLMHTQPNKHPSHKQKYTQLKTTFSFIHFCFSLFDTL